MHEEDEIELTISNIEEQCRGEGLTTIHEAFDSVELDESESTIGYPSLYVVKIEINIIKFGLRNITTKVAYPILNQMMEVTYFSNTKMLIYISTIMPPMSQSTATQINQYTKSCF